MTLLIGSNLGSYVIIAADTRTTWSHRLFGKGYRDGDHKIAMWDLGLVTGAGYLEALESVKKELLTKEITQTNEVIEIIKEQALPKIDELLKNNPWIKDKTCFFILYINLEKRLRLALIHPDWNYQLRFCNDPVAVMPIDLNEKENEKYNAFLRKNLIKFEDRRLTKDKIKKNLSHNVNLIAKCFSEISKKSVYVSKDVDFAVLLLNGNIMYGYCKSVDVMNGEFRMSTVSPVHQTCLLTPNVIRDATT